MVYVYTLHSEINKIVGKDLKVEEIKNTLKELGMDLKGEKETEKGTELKIEITAEKLDMISTVGIGRAIKYYLGLANEIPSYKIKESNKEVIIKNNVKARPKIVAAIIKNLEVTEEVLEDLIKLQEKLHESFGRNRKKAAIGIYPLKKIKFPVTYQEEDPEAIKFIPLSHDKELTGKEILEKTEIGKKYSHLISNHSKYPVLRDSDNKILSMPPIINSEDIGKVTPGKQDLFIECSGFNIELLDNILKVIVTTILEIGGEAESVKINYNNETYKLNLNNYKETFNLKDACSLIGIQISSEELPTLMKKMMYNVTEIKNNNVTVEIPVFRSDIWSDVDIADDLARAYGYNNITPRFPNIASIGGMKKFSMLKDTICQTMTELGFLECYNFILTSTDTQFRLINLKPENFKYLKISDSADEGINMGRIHLFPSLLKTLEENKKSKYPQKIFELGFTIQVDESQDTKARNESHLSAAIAGPKTTFTQIKSTLDTLSKIMSWPLKIKESNLPYLIEGRQGHIFYNNKEIGFIGELHPEILSKLSFLVPIALFEINLESFKNEN